MDFDELEGTMNDIGLYEHETIGSHYIWLNKHTNDFIYSRIDRAICNRFWFLKFPNCETEVLNAYISDHSSLRVNLVGHNIGRIRQQPRLKFQNSVVGNYEFMEMVTNSWNNDESGRPMYIIWRKLKHLRLILQGPNRKATEGVQKLQEYKM